MPFSALLADAIRHAREGFSVSRSQAFWLDSAAAKPAPARYLRLSSCQTGFLPEVGSLFRQEGLARSLELIARHGPRSFYEGELAERLAAGLEAAGSPLTRLRGFDLAASYFPTMCTD